MTQLEISPSLFALLQQQAQASGLSVETWLSHQVESQQAQELAEFHTWFVHLVAHDLRTPLAAIMSSSEILKHYQDRLSATRQAEHLDTIQLQVRMLDHLLDHVMVIQKSEIGALAVVPVVQDLEAVCRAAVEDMNDMVRERPDVQVEVRGEMRPVACDERLLRLALTCLLRNAVQYGPEGVPICLTLTVDSDRAVIQVIDEGMGIPPEEIGRVWELFYRASNVRHTTGQGLGLAVTRRVMDLHGGTLHLDSALDKGTTVTITLPLG